MEHLVVLMFGVLIGMGISMGVAEWRETPINEMQRQCERALPRNQHCVMQFVPEVKQ